MFYAMARKESDKASIDAIGYPVDTDCFFLFSSVVEDVNQPEAHHRVELQGRATNSVYLTRTAAATFFDANNFNEWFVGVF